MAGGGQAVAGGVKLLRWKVGSLSDTASRKLSSPTSLSRGKYRSKVIFHIVQNVIDPSQLCDEEVGTASMVSHPCSY
jgi:hypothetical protein